MRAEYCPKAALSVAAYARKACTLSNRLRPPVVTKSNWKPHPVNVGFQPMPLASRRMPMASVVAEMISTCTPAFLSRNRGAVNEAELGSTASGVATSRPMRWAWGRKPSVSALYDAWLT